MPWRNLLLVAVAVLTGSSCAVHKPQTYRLAPAGSSHILVPPGIATADIARGSLSIKPPKGRSCAPAGDAVAVERRAGKLRLSVARDLLLKQPSGWLRQWATEFETQGCIAAGTGLDFAARILETLPLDPAAVYRLLHGDSVQQGYVELGPENRLQTQAPIMKSGKPAETNAIDIVSVAGRGNSLDVDIRSSEEVLGVETSWYALAPKTDGPGARIVTLSSERRIDGKTEAAAGPMENYFRFTPDIGFYRLIYKADLGEKGATTEIVVGAPDRVELERRTRLVLDNFDTCRVSDLSMCALIPRHVALNAVMAVTVNGAEVRVGIRGTVRGAIWQAGGPRNAEEVLPRLSVRKPCGGKLVDVDFDRGSSAILDVMLLGGEEISWK